MLLVEACMNCVDCAAQFLFPKFPNADEADRTGPLVLDDGATSKQNSSFPLSLIGPNVQTNPFAACWPGGIYIVFFRWSWLKYIKVGLLAMVFIIKYYFIFWLIEECFVSSSTSTCLCLVWLSSGWPSLPTQDDRFSWLVPGVVGETEGLKMALGTQGFIYSVCVHSCT